MRRLVSVFLILLLCTFSFLYSTQKVESAQEQTIVKFDPASVVTGFEQTFTLSAVLWDIADLYSFDLEISWNTTLFDYVEYHWVKIPREHFQDGVLHQPVNIIHDDVNASIGRYRLNATSLPPADLFEGTGIAFEMTFRVVLPPPEPETNITSSIVFVNHEIWGPGYWIAHLKYDCDVTISRFIASDVNLDWKVDIFDLVLCGSSYGSTSLDPNWNPDCDIAGPYGVIDILDIVTVASCYGEEYIP